MSPSEMPGRSGGPPRSPVVALEPPLPRFPPQPQEELPAGRQLQVQADALLAPIDGEEVAALAIDVGGGSAGDVAERRTLYLADLRAEVAQDHGGVRPGQDPGEVQHDEAGEGAGGPLAFLHGRPMIAGRRGLGPAPAG